MVFIVWSPSWQFVFVFVFVVRVVYIIWSLIGSFYFFLFLLFRVVFIILPTIGSFFFSCFSGLFFKFGPHLAAHSFWFLLFRVWTLVVFVVVVRAGVAQLAACSFLWSQSSSLYFFFFLIKAGSVCQCALPIDQTA